MSRTGWDLRRRHTEPAADALEAALVEDLQMFRVGHVTELVRHLTEGEATTFLHSGRNLMHRGLLPFTVIARLVS